MTLKIVLRNLRKRPLLNAIKIVGLSLALSSTLLIALFLKHELSYDSYHEKSDRIYRFTTTNPAFFSGKHFARTFNPSYIPQMSETFSEIEDYVRLAPLRGGVLEYNKEYLSIHQAFECDSTFFNVFNADLLLGNPDKVLEAPGSVVISENFAKKAFGNNNPIGEILTRPAGQFYGEDTDYTVTGVMTNFPPNSHIHPDVLATPLDRNIFRAWGWTYLVLYPNTNPDHIIEGFKDFFASYIQTDSDSVQTVAHLQALTDIHLHSKKTREIESNSNMSVIYSFSIAVLLLLFIAYVNYANLNIGMAGYSEKFLHISKVFGSPGGLRLNYFLTEGGLIAMASIVLSALVSALVIILIQRQFAMNLFSGNLPFMLAIFLLFSLLALLAGTLPLLNRYIMQRGISKGLIVLQYSITIALMVGVFVIHRQTTFALNSSLGVGSENLICFNGVHSSVQQKFPEFKDELLIHSSIQSVSAMLERPGDDANDMFQFTLEGYEPDENPATTDRIGVFPCDYSFASLFDLNFLGGSNFSEKYEDNEGSGEYIINESAMRRLNHTNPTEIVGKEFDLIFNGEGIEIPSGRIIGVVEDFHLSSMKRMIEPLVLFKRKQLWLINFLIAFQPGEQEKALDDIKRVWTDIYPAYSMDYSFVDSMYREVYSTELLQALLLSIFTFIALFICSMGLLGLSLLTTKRRIKEIGIRKVNGATTGEVMRMLNWDFMKWILLSLLLAIPFAYFAMSKWLESFAYKTPLSWWIFAVAGIAAMIIALATVSLQSWRASSKNPVEALRYE